MTVSDSAICGTQTSLSTGKIERSVWFFCFGYAGLLVCVVFAAFIENAEPVARYLESLVPFGLHKNTVKIVVGMAPLLMQTCFLQLLSDKPNKTNAIFYCIPIGIAFFIFCMVNGTIDERTTILLIYCFLAFLLASSASLKFDFTLELPGGPQDKLIERISSVLTLIFLPLTLSLAVGYFFQSALAPSLPLFALIVLMLSLVGRKLGNRIITFFACALALGFVSYAWAFTNEIRLSLIGH